MTRRNLGAMAVSTGGSLDEIVKGSAFRASIDSFPEFIATSERIFSSRQPQPARTTSGADLRDIFVEIDAVLYLPQR